MHEMQTIVTDVRGVCPQVCQHVCHAGSFGAVFAKSLWPLLHIANSLITFKQANCSQQKADDIGDGMEV